MRRQARSSDQGRKADKAAGRRGRRRSTGATPDYWIASPRLFKAACARGRRRKTRGTRGPSAGGWVAHVARQGRCQVLWGSASMRLIRRAKSGGT